MQKTNLVWYLQEPMAEENKIDFFRFCAQHSSTPSLQYTSLLWWMENL